MSRWGAQIGTLTGLVARQGLRAMTAPESLASVAHPDIHLVRIRLFCSAGSNIFSCSSITSSGQSYATPLSKMGTMSL